MVYLNLCDIGEIKALLARHGFHFSKGLGQNFLRDARIPQAIAENANIGRQTGVLEVGPGIGALTQQLCRRARRVAAVELDRRLPPVLAETMAEFDNLTVVEGDILKTDIPALCRRELGPGPWVACANLPYYITTPALSALIESRCFGSVTVMVQKEVAQRICARAATAEYGAFSVYCQYHGAPQIVLRVPAGCFVPAPKVDSAVVRLDLYPAGQNPLGPVDQALFFRVVRAAFGQRRKMLSNCLRQGFPQLDKEQILECLTDAGLPEKVRGEQLDLAQFARLTEEIGRRISADNPAAGEGR